MAETNPSSTGEGSLVWSTGTTVNITGCIVESADPKPINDGPLATLENENGKRIGFMTEGMADGYSFDQDITVSGKLKSTITPPKPNTAVTYTLKSGTTLSCYTISPFVISKKRKQYCDFSVKLAFSELIA
jgi:hypothetical protein